MFAERKATIFLIGIETITTSRSSQKKNIHPLAHVGVKRSIPTYYHVDCRRLLDILANDNDGKSDNKAMAMNVTGRDEDIADEGTQGSVPSDSSPTTLLDQMDEVILDILSFVPTKDLARSRHVCLKFNSLCQTAITRKPKKVFNTNQELRDAVILYCHQDKSQRNKVHCMYGRVINQWNVSKVKDFSWTFENMREFNENIEDWDTSSVTNMCSMFRGATSFNQSLDGWDTSRVTDMGGMFCGATSFNQPLEGWNTSSVTDMSGMFCGAASFNQPLDGWNTSSVTTMSFMFFGAVSFNQPLDGWNTSSVTNMSSMFCGAASFNQPLEGWNTSSVTNMYSMFGGATSFNHPLEGWDTSRVIDIGDMFYQAD